MSVAWYCQQFYCKCALNQPARKLRSYVNQLITQSFSLPRMHSRTVQNLYFDLAALLCFNLLHRGPILSICLHAVLFSHLYCFLPVSVRWGGLCSSSALCLTCRLHFWVRPEREKLPATLLLALSTAQLLSELRHLFFLECPPITHTHTLLFKYAEPHLLCLYVKESWLSMCSHIHPVMPLRAAL